MIYLGIFLVAVLTTACAWSQEVSHFRRAEIPRNESRLSELARVQEFRCNYDLAHLTHSTLLIAEVFQDGMCVDRYRLSLSVNDLTKKEKTGVISFGWQRDNHDLVSVQDNGYFPTPWVASIHLPGFTPAAACYFSDSYPEKRKPDEEGGFFDFELTR